MTSNFKYNFQLEHNFCISFSDKNKCCMVVEWFLVYFWNQQSNNYFIYLHDFGKQCMTDLLGYNE
jgi:hypothetical protein